MRFEDADLVQSIAWQLRYGDWFRGTNRARINTLFNGAPPYSAEEVEENNINVNVNFLEATTLSHDARSQFASAFQKPGNYFRCSTDMGPLHKRNERGVIVTKAVNRIMKRSLEYYETMRSKFALLVMHGIAPGSWDNGDSWCPIAMGVEDLMVPSDTLLSFRNMPFFIKMRAYTAPELIKLTKGAKRDRGWNMKLVDACIKWVDKESQTLLGSNFPNIWSPEKMAERLKSDGGYYMGDRVPTINVFDFWYWSDEGGNGGWRRRMVLDTWSAPTGIAPEMSANKAMDFAKGQWLYNSGDVVKATTREQIFSCQFADLSSVAPFRYHSVRSLGFLLYAVCHLQNRLRCRLTETTFEQLMMLFRVKSMEDVQRVVKVDLYNRGFIDESVQFIPGSERFQPNYQMAELGISQISDLIARHSSSFTSQPQSNVSDVEKTKFQVQAETQTATAMVSIGLQQAYTYQTFEYKEIFRRFCKSNSRDPDVVRFQAECLRGGVPKSYLDATQWDIEPERVMGAGNKTLEMSIAQQLMTYRNLFDPGPQRQILHDVTLAITDDPARADQLVPENPVTITDAVHDAQLAAGTLMQGLPVALKTGMNHIEYVDTLMATMAHIIQGAQAQGGMPDIKIIQGLQNMANHIAQHIGIIAQDPNEKQRVKQYGDQLGKMMNLVKAMAQRLVEQMQKQQQGGEGGDAQEAAKAQATIIAAQTKAQISSSSHAQKTAQRQIQFEQNMQQREQEHELELKVKAAEAGIDLTQQKLKALNETKKEGEVE